jgi:hypothetical protein
MKIMHLVSSQHERKIKVRILALFWREMKSLAKSWERYDNAMNRATESCQAEFRRGKSRNSMIKLEDTQYAFEPRNEFVED